LAGRKRRTLLLLAMHPGWSQKKSAFLLADVATGSRAVFALREATLLMPKIFWLQM